MAINLNAKSAREVIAWAESKAAYYADLAATLKKALHEEGVLISPNQNQQTSPHLPTLGHVTVEQLRNRLQNKNGRVVNLASEFGVDEQSIRNLIQQPNSGIEIGPRGWLVLVDDFKDLGAKNGSH